MTLAEAQWCPEEFSFRWLDLDTADAYTWVRAVDFCRGRGGQLASWSEYFPEGKGGPLFPGAGRQDRSAAGAAPPVAGGRRSVNELGSTTGVN